MNFNRKQQQQQNQNGSETTSGSSGSFVENRIQLATNVNQIIDKNEVTTTVITNLNISANGPTGMLVNSTTQPNSPNSSLVLPVINLNQVNNKNTVNNNSESVPKYSSGGSASLNASQMNSSSFSSGFMNIRPNALNNFRNTLNDAKAFLESENSQVKFNLETPTLPNNSRVNSASLNPGISFENSPTPPLITPRSRCNIKKFEFQFDTSPNQSKVDLKSEKNRSVFVRNLSGSNSSQSDATPSMSTLNLPWSSRSSSASSVSLSSSTSSLPTINRLEAVNHEKYKDIIKNSGFLFINDNRIKTTTKDLISICELGSGTCGLVVKMKHNETNQVMAVKQMNLSGIFEENRRILMDLEVVLKSNDCSDIVKCLGYFITDSDVWICMELMSMCFDKLLKLIKTPIPEEILGKLCVSTLNALNYLKEQHNVIHRDVKPSNILIDENGSIKLCDFGISGNLVNSNAFSRNNAGCAGYMAPERIDPDPNNPVYDIRADVWSLGITLVELATGEYPYKNCNNEFAVMSTILGSEAPTLEGDQFTDMFKSFVNRCLTKDVKMRPKYNALLQDPFIQHYKNTSVDVKSWFKNVLIKANYKSSESCTVKNENSSDEINLINS